MKGWRVKTSTKQGRLTISQFVSVHIPVFQEHQDAEVDGLRNEVQANATNSSPQEKLPGPQRRVSVQTWEED